MKEKFKNTRILKKTVRPDNDKILNQVQDDSLIKNNGVGKTVRPDKAQMLKQVQHDMVWFRRGFGALAPDKNLSPFTSHFSRRAAFTLAEVLITLGIIGVVAAMTLPTLVQSYKRHVVETKLAKFYSVMNNAIKLSEVENGEFKTWDTLGYSCNLDEETEKCAEGTIDALNWYNKYLKNYVRVVKVNTIRTSTGLEACNLYFPDGTVLSFHGKGVALYLNVSDFEKSLKSGELDSSSYENDDGIKCFTFDFYRDDLHSAFDVYNNLYDSEETKIASCSRRTAGLVKGTYCAYLIKKNGWKIPKDYPWKF